MNLEFVVTVLFRLLALKLKIILKFSPDFKKKWFNYSLIT